MVTPDLDTPAGRGPGGIGERMQSTPPPVSLVRTVITGMTPYRIASRIVFDNRHGGNSDSVALIPAPGKVLLSLIRMTLFGQRRRWFWNSAWSVYYLCSAHSHALAIFVYRSKRRIETHDPSHKQYFLFFHRTR